MEFSLSEQLVNSVFLVSDKDRLNNLKLKTIKPRGINYSPLDAKFSMSMLEAVFPMPVSDSNYSID